VGTSAHERLRTVCNDDRPAGAALWALVNDVVAAGPVKEVRAMGGIYKKAFFLASCLKLATFIALLFFTSSNADAQSQPYFGRTTDPTLVDIAVQDKNEIVHFMIPKVFMTFSKNWNGGLQSGITLEVIYPSMAALSASRNSTKGPDVVIINLQSFAHTGADYSVVKLLP
jgi:hypothetical protein